MGNLAMTVLPDILFLPYFYWKTEICFLFSPPEFSADDKVKIAHYNVAARQLPDLMDDVNYLKGKVAKLERNRGPPASIDLYRAMLQEKEHEAAGIRPIVESYGNMSATGKESLAELSENPTHLPIIAYVWALTNLGLGYASWLILKSDVTEVLFGTDTNTLFWSHFIANWMIYPHLFKYENYLVSIMHFYITTGHAAMCAYVFYSRIDPLAGYMMVPHVLQLMYATYFMSAIGHEECEVRLGMASMVYDYKGRKKHQ